jgi:hypothetical protein
LFRLASGLNLDGSGAFQQAAPSMENLLILFLRRARYIGHEN